MSDTNRCDRQDAVRAYAARALSASETAAAEAHLAACAVCRSELAALHANLGSSAAEPTDVLRPVPSLRARLADRIAAETGAEPVVPAVRQWAEPEWKEVAPGLSCKLLAIDRVNDRVSMLVHLAPSVEYPPHVHSGVEELHLLDGELWIDDKKFYPGDYSRAEPGTDDKRVWSETGCTCFLTTSTKDILL